MNQLNSSTMNVTMAPTVGIKDMVLGGTLLTINLLIIISNILTILVIARIRHKSAIDIFIMALALMDLVKGLVPVPMSVIIYLTDWYLEKGSFACNFFGWIAFTTNSGSMLILTLMSIERFWAVVKPFAYKAIVTPKKTIYVACASVVFTSIHSVLPILGVGQMLPYYKGAYAHFDYSKHSKGTIIYSLFIIAYGFTMIIVVMVAYSFVFYKIRNLIHRHRRMSVSVKTKKANLPRIAKELKLKTEKMFSYLTVTLMLLFWFSWLPFLVVVLSSQLGIGHLDSKLDLIAMRIAVINSILNPLACALLCKPYRRGVLYYFKVVFHLFGYRKPESDVFDPWRKNSFACNNRKYKLNNGTEDATQRDNKWSSNDSGIATGEYSRTRIPSILETYDSYRKRMNTTTSSINDDNSPESKRLDTLKETPSQRASLEENESDDLLTENRPNEEVFDEENDIEMEPPGSSSPINYEEPQSPIYVAEKNLNKSLLIPDEIIQEHSPNTKKLLLLDRIHKYFAPKKENKIKHKKRNRSNSADDILDSAYKKRGKSIISLEEENYEKLMKIQKENEKANHLEDIVKDLNNFKISLTELNDTILSVSLHNINKNRSDENLSKDNDLKEHNNEKNSRNILHKVDITAPPSQKQSTPNGVLSHEEQDIGTSELNDDLSQSSLYSIIEATSDKM